MYSATEDKATLSYGFLYMANSAAVMPIGFNYKLTVTLIKERRWALRRASQPFLLKFVDFAFGSFAASSTSWFSLRRWLPHPSTCRRTLPS